jgi:hypothetical protein
MLPRKIIIVGMHDSKEVIQVIKKLELEKFGKINTNLQTYISKNVICFLNFSPFLVIHTDHTGYLDLSEEIISDTDALVFIVKDSTNVYSHQLSRGLFNDKVKIFINFQEIEDKNNPEFKQFYFKSFQPLEFYNYITQRLINQEATPHLRFLQLFAYQEENNYPEAIWKDFENWIKSCKKSLNEEKNNFLNIAQILTETLNEVTFNTLKVINSRLDELEMIRGEVRLRKTLLLKIFQSKFEEKMVFKSDFYNKLQEIHKILEDIKNPNFFLCKDESFSCISFNKLSLEEYFPTTTKKRSLRIQDLVFFDLNHVLAGRLKSSYIFFQESLKKNEKFICFKFNPDLEDPNEETLKKINFSCKFPGKSSVRMANSFFFIITEKSKEKQESLVTVNINDGSKKEFKILKTFKVSKHFFVVQHGSNFLIAGSSSIGSAFNIFLCDMEKNCLTNHLTIAKNLSIMGKMKFFSSVGLGFTVVFFKYVFVEVFGDERNVQKLNLTINGKVKNQAIVIGQFIYSHSISSLKHIIYKFSLTSKNLEIVETFDR